MPSPRARRNSLPKRPGLRAGFTRAAVVLASDDRGCEERTGENGMRFSANVSILFKEVPFLERFGRAAATGFSTVEFWWPSDEDTGAVEKAVKDANLQVALINFDAGDMAAGDRGLA